MKENRNGNPGAAGGGESEDSTIIDATAAARRARPRPNRSAPAGAKVDIWLVLDVLARRWHWLILGALVVGGGFFMLGWSLIKNKYTASAQLQRYEPQTSEGFQLPKYSSETFSSLAK